MKMIIHSDFKEFNKQTNLITSGNVIANTMWGNYIRPYNETINPDGQVVSEGQLFDFVLQYFSINKAMREYIKSLNRKVILYEIFIYRGQRKDIIGWLIGDKGRIIDITVAKSSGNYRKRFSALETVKNIIEERDCL